MVGCSGPGQRLLTQLGERRDRNHDHCASPPVDADPRPRETEPEEPEAMDDFVVVLEERRARRRRAPKSNEDDERPPNRRRDTPAARNVWNQSSLPVAAQYEINSLSSTIREW